MIFVTVGTSPFDFSRLVKAMDEIAGKINESVEIQTGYTKFAPKNAKYYKFLSKNEFDELVRDSRVVVGHAGEGTIIAAIRFNKPLIVVPRLKKYGEHNDNHQLEIANELEKEGKIMAIYNINDLEDALHRVGENPVRVGSERIRLVNALRKYIKSVEKGKYK